MKVLSYLSYLTSQLHEKREQIVRLRNSHSTLNALQGEFLQHQSSVTALDLTPTTWQGTLANAFTEIREDMLLSYKDLSHNQMDTAISTIEDKIASLRTEIQSLETSISNERARIEQEQRKAPR
jgi:septal ring factor EnvC (AmiA/AmiB activator)